MQIAVEELKRLGRMPSEVSFEIPMVERYQRLLAAIEQPISDDDAVELMEILGPDDCFGLSWTVVHIIETAPGWPIKEAIEKEGSEWNSVLKNRAGL